MNIGEIVNDKVLEVYENFQSPSDNKPEITHVDIPPIESISIEKTCNDSDNVPSVFTSPIKDEQFSSIDNPSSELFYDFQAENFHAEQVTFSLIIPSLEKKPSLIKGCSICLYYM